MSGRDQLFVIRRLCSAQRPPIVRFGRFQVAQTVKRQTRVGRPDNLVMYQAQFPGLLFRLLKSKSDFSKSPSL